MVANGQASVIVGTWSINQVVSAEPVATSDVFMVSGFGKGRYLNIESSATSAANLEWYVREFIERRGHHEDPFGYCNQLVAETEPAPDDPMYHPFLYGARLGSEMRAGFYGISGWHTEGHMLRALYEGVMFEHRRHIEVLTAAGLRFDDVILSGRRRTQPGLAANIRRRAGQAGHHRRLPGKPARSALQSRRAVARECSHPMKAGVEKMTRAKKIVHTQWRFAKSIMTGAMSCSSNLARI